MAISASPTKGTLVIGAGVDSYNGYGQRGSFHVVEHTVQAIWRTISRLQPGAYESPVGRHCRHLPRCLPDYQQDLGRRALL